MYLWRAGFPFFFQTFEIFLAEYEGVDGKILGDSSWAIIQWAVCTVCQVKLHSSLSLSLSKLSGCHERRTVNG